jgi:hypothetical protein
MKVQAQHFGAEFIHGSVIDTDLSGGRSASTSKANGWRPAP